MKNVHFLRIISAFNIFEVDLDPPPTVFPLQTLFLTSSTSSVIWNLFCMPLLAASGSW